MSASQVVYPTYEELLHQLRKAKSENDGLRYALDERVEQVGEDAERAERAQSRLWFHAYRESQRQNRVLREEIARMKEGRGG